MSKPLPAAGAQKGGQKSKCDSLYDLDDDFASSPLKLFLTKEPEARDIDGVKDALAWWLQNLPINGSRLSPELQVADSVLLDAFCRGRFCVYSPGQKLQEEGEEVRHYTIILVGKCRLRCRPPAASKSKAPNAIEEDQDEDLGLDSDGLVHCDTLCRGEAFGLIPGDPRAPYDVTCVDKAMLLMLSVQDYAATFKAHHRALQAKAFEFLQKHHICTQAMSHQLQRLASCFRHRRVHQGALIMKSGEFQRHIWILSEGTCSVLASRQDALQLQRDDVDDHEQTSSSEDEVADPVRIAKLRTASYGARMQQAAAAEEKKRATLAKYARASYRKALQANPKAPFNAIQQGDMKIIAVMSEPGVALGEEALITEDFRKLLTAKCHYTVRVDTDCLFYTVDVSYFRQMAMYMGVESAAKKVSAKLNRRCKHLSRNESAAKLLNKETHKLQQEEVQKQRRQKIMLPSYDGSKSKVMELEDVNDWLQVVLKHRKAPVNKNSPPTLACLDGLGLNPAATNVGPGVEAMIKVFTDEASLKKHRVEMKSGRIPGHRGIVGPSENPMGEVIPAGAKYSSTMPPGWEDPEDLPAEAIMNEGPGIFFQTEPDLDESEVLSTPARSSSVPTLPRLPCTTHQVIEEEPSAHKLPKHLAHSRSFTTSKVSTEKSRGPSYEQNRIMKAFQKAMPGKSILVFTDKADVRKSIMRAVLSAETCLTFVKNTVELWQRLRDAKEEHHLLIVDLTKSELQIESFVKMIRQHERYNMLPIVVLSANHDLPEVVRSSCSFVVFFPLAAATVREALLWCFKPRALQGSSKQTTCELDVSKISRVSAFAKDIQNLRLSATAAPIS